jgi:uncharacterized protein (TIGR03546 family)
MFLVRQLFALLRLLHSENGDQSIAIGVSLGFILGLTPILSLQGILLLLVLVFCRIQMAAALLSWLAFSFFPLLIPQPLNYVGEVVLEASFLRPLWTAFYKAPVLPLSQFNNTIVMGGFIIGLLGSPLVYKGALYLVTKYRATAGAYISNTKLIKVIKGSKLYNWYNTYEQNWS